MLNAWTCQTPAIAGDQPCHLQDQRRAKLRVFIRADIERFKRWRGTAGQYESCRANNRRDGRATVKAQPFGNGIAPIQPKRRIGIGQG